MARCEDYCSCLICGSIVVSICVVPFVVIVLYSSPSGPSFSVNASFNMTRADDSPTNLTIHFDLKLKNENKAIGLHYPDPLQITFSYFPKVSFLVIIAKYKVDSFYQGNGKTRHVQDVVESNVIPRVLEGTDKIAFRVDLVGTFRYKKATSKRQKVELGCLVDVDYTTGKKMHGGFIKLVEPGLDSKLKKKPPQPRGGYL